MSRSTYVITGATGFVGGALASRLLREGNRVFCLVRDGYPPSGAEVIRGDLQNYDDCRRLISKAGANCRVFHLAAQAKVGYARHNRMETFESNIRGTYNLLEAVHVHSPWSPVVVASSDKAYGELPEDTDRYEETMAMEGRGFYDVSKSCTDLITRSYAASGMIAAVVRMGNIYGQTDKDLTRVMPSFCRDVAVLAQPPRIMSDGTPIRDYLHIRDAVDAYQRVMERMVRYGDQYRGVSYNFSGGEPLSVLELADKVLDIGIAEGYAIFSGNRPVVEGTRVGEIQTQLLDCEKAWSELGWKPQVTLKQGIIETLKWWDTEGRSL